MTGWFITGAGTEIGKTYVTCRLVRELRAAGKHVRAIKPVISGFDPDHPADSDTGLLLAAMEEPVDAAAIGAVSPWRFADPISPDMAAAREGRRLDAREIATFCRYAAPGGEDGMVLVEGIGGVMVPLNDKETVLDWMGYLGWPVLLVAGSYLGALSHFLTAAAALQGRGLTIGGIVVSQSAENPVTLEETVATIENFAGGVPVVALPRNAPPGDPDIWRILFS
ncbi:MAG: dethiobiotin synthase [Rhodospirillaceae bacterium]